MDKSTKIYEEYRRKLAELKAFRAEAERIGINLDESKTETPLVSASELFADYIGRLNAGELPQLLRLGSTLDGLEVGAGLICLIGAPPGSGKTALSSQVMFEAFENDASQIAYLMNAEMGFDSIARRELTRLTGIGSDKIRFGDLSYTEGQRIAEAAESLMPLLRRLKVEQEPTHESLLRLLDAPPGLVVVDYLQKFAPSDKDVRLGVNLVMTTLRRLAKHGHAILALSSTKRDAKGGHSSSELSLSSFKESGECEFQADSAYVLRDNGPIDFDWVRDITLGCVKNRNGRKVDFDLVFHMSEMRFSTKEPAYHVDLAEFMTSGPLDYAANPYDQGGDE
jgi:replicative DNA helicase